MLILKVWKAKKNGAKLVTIPKECNFINDGDYIKVMRVEDTDNIILAMEKKIKQLESKE